MLRWRKKIFFYCFGVLRGGEKKAFFLVSMRNVSFYKCYETKNACHIEKEVCINKAMKDKLKRTTAPKRPNCSLSRMHGRCGLMRMLVFCFLVKETKDMNSVAGFTFFDHQRFLFFSSCVGGIAPFRPRTLSPPLFSIDLTKTRRQDPC